MPHSMSSMYWNSLSGILVYVLCEKVLFNLFVVNVLSILDKGLCHIIALPDPFYLEILYA